MTGRAHVAAQAAYVRGMHAALRYLSLCLEHAPAPPDSPAAQAAGDASAASLALPLLGSSPDARDFFFVAANPAMRALTCSLRNHEQGAAWRHFLEVVAVGAVGVATAADRQLWRMQPGQAEAAAYARALEFAESEGEDGSDAYGYDDDDDVSGCEDDAAW